MTQEVNSPKDRCPDWADKIIKALRDLEVKLGHIPDHPQWQTREFEQLQTRLMTEYDADLVAEESLTEELFKKVARGLKSENFTSQEIAQFINSRIGYKGGPPYCSASEVEEAF